MDCQLISWFGCRLTFSASPSGDERKRQSASEHTTLAVLEAEKRRKSVRRTLTLPHSEAATSVTTGEHVATAESSEAEGDNQHHTTTIVGGGAGPNGSVSSHTESSFHPKKTSTQVKGGRKRGGRSAAKKGSGRPVKSSVRALESDSEDGGMEDDQELMTLLEPSIHVPRLVGLSQLTQSRKSRGGQKSAAPSTVDSSHGESTDEEQIPPPQQSKGDNPQLAKESRSKSKKLTSRAEGTATILTKKSGKGKRKSSRKSVAFNPHTTNLGSPELPPPNSVATVASVSGENAATEESDTGGSSSGVYDYVPSDEEDYSHTKSRLYSPRRKSILRKAASLKKGGTQQKKKTEKGGAQEVTKGSGGKKESKKTPKSRGRGIQEVPVPVESMASKEQWFVPNDLSMHKMIAEDSPQSLRRLTRSGKSGMSDLSTSRVVAPSKRQKQRPRELDSTVRSREPEGGDSASEKSEDGKRKCDLASQNGGLSSADEELVSSTDTRRLGSDSGEGQGKITQSNKRSSRSAKLTPPWIQNKRNKRTALPKSALDQEGDEEQEEEEVERTPASKKLRVTLPTEEDEGMQSGGAMFLSSSEEDDEANLVRSLGGRRYRRYTVEHQNTKTPGVRRSKRTRLAPVQHWRNEEPEYERRRSGMRMTEYLHTVLCV